ncbi:Ig-like domain-containing protein [Okeania sp. SIO2B3]|uniref:Ig-like domain-containing protein n=1 Tax=Okeania sp. SIO2B3 TaxID=2607784 RepID=UPI0013C2005F|nr:Ig-like domain-containing protein [Okeania sp. SIO2B3]NET42562.1 hypothetical protein [Okeania sp. SIO2B3]
MLSNDELNIFQTDSLTVPSLVNNNDNEFNFPQPLLSSEDTFTVLSPVDDETLRIASQLISEIEVNNIDGTHRRDNLVGTDSNDIITGFLGADTLTGGDGKDIFVYTSMRDRRDIITDFEVGQDKIDFTKLLEQIGFTGDDPVASGHVGLQTNDTDAIITIDQDGKDGRAGHISVITLPELGPGARENENFLTEVLIDSNSIEVNNIDGTRSRDNLVGTDGNDTITGFLGIDTLTGGDGKDTFVYTTISPMDGIDIITDFELGQDKIDFTGVLDRIGFTGDDPVASGYVGLGTNRGDPAVNIYRNGGGRGRAISFVRLQGLADDVVDNESFLADVLGLNSDVSVPIVSAELLNDTGEDDSDGITSDPTIIGTINTESEVVSLTAGFNDTSVEDFVDVTTALLEDGTFELDQELLEDVFGDTLTNEAYTLKLQATDSNGNLSEVIELEFTLDLDTVAPIISAELANDTGEDDSDNITSDPTIIGTINTESEIVSLTAGFNETPAEDFVDITTGLLEDGTFELDQELLEEVLGDTLTNGTYTLKLQGTDSNGNLSEVIELEFTLDLDVEAPIISAELANDTGENDTDNITSDPTIVGSVNVEGGIVGLTAGFNETPPEEFVDITDALLEDGTFELDREFLEDILGDTLTNGTYTLKLQTTDNDNNLSEVIEFEFTLDS